MKTFRNLFITCISTFTFLAQAQTSRTTVDSPSTINNMDKTGQVGVGLEVGSLSGLSVDYWHSPSQSWNASLLADYGNTAAAFAHEWMFAGAFSDAPSALVPYVGAGALMAFGERQDYFVDRTQSFAMALQAPLGLQYLPLHQRFSIFAELKPSLEVIPVTAAFLNADLGARFYF